MASDLNEIEFASGTMVNDMAENVSFGRIPPDSLQEANPKSPSNFRLSYSDDDWIFDSLGGSSAGEIKADKKASKSEESKKDDGYTEKVKEAVAKAEEEFRIQKENYFKNMNTLIETARKQIGELLNEKKYLETKLLANGILECPNCKNVLTISKNSMKPKYVKVLKGRCTVDLQFESYDALRKWLLLSNLDTDREGIPVIIGAESTASTFAFDDQASIASCSRSTPISSCESAVPSLDTEGKEFSSKNLAGLPDGQRIKMTNTEGKQERHCDSRNLSHSKSKKEDPKSSLTRTSRDRGERCSRLSLNSSRERFKRTEYVSPKGRDTKQFLAASLHKQHRGAEAKRRGPKHPSASALHNFPKRVEDTFYEKRSDRRLPASHEHLRRREDGSCEKRKKFNEMFDDAKDSKRERQISLEKETRGRRKSGIGMPTHRLR